MCTLAFHWYKNQWPWITLNVFASLYLPKWRFSGSLRKNMSQTISNIRPRILLTIKSTDSIDELRIICQGSLYTHCCRASPMLQLSFLVRTWRNLLQLAWIFVFYIVDQVIKSHRCVFDCRQTASTSKYVLHILSIKFHYRSHIANRDGVLEGWPRPRGHLEDKILWPWPWP